MSVMILLQMQCIPRPGHPSGPNRVQHTQGTEKDFLAIGFLTTTGSSALYWGKFIDSYT